jgi:hypothetical protein
VQAVTALVLVLANSSPWTFATSQGRLELSWSDTTPASLAVAGPPGAPTSIRLDSDTFDVGAIDLHLSGLPDPLVVVVAAASRADTTLLEYILLAVVDGRLQEVMPEHLTVRADEAVYIDPSPQAASVMTAVERDEDDGIPCICWPHRATITKYAWDGRGFSRLLRTSTTKTYPSAEAAAHAACIRGNRID